MKQAGISWVLAAAMGLCVTTPAQAVTVNIDIETEGEPVPGASISFQTPDGEDVPGIQLTAVEEPQDSPETEAADDPPQTDQPDDQADSDQATEEDKPNPDTARQDDPENKGGYQVDVPDELIGVQLVLVVMKDDEVVKKDPIQVDDDTSQVTVEAYDPVDAGVSIQLSQDEKCKRGRKCGYGLEVSNEGNGIYKGPLFLTGVLHGTLLASDEPGDWQCAYSGRGKQICYNQVSLEPGAKQSWSLDVRLPRRMSRRSTNCLQVNVFDQQSSGRVDPLLMAVQLGLAELGYKVGRPDGVHGPRTEAAMQQFSDENPDVAPDDLPGMFTVLFGMSPDRLARLGVSGGKNCQRVALHTPPKAAKKVSTSSRRRQRSRDADEYRDDRYDPAVNIGIGIGLGALGYGLSRGRKYERRERRRREKYFD